MKNKFTIPGLVLLVIFLIALTNCSKDDEIIVLPEKYLELGVILPLDQEKGLLRQNALQLAIDMINDAGGVNNGYQIKVRIASSAGEDRKTAAAIAAMNLINEHKLLVGLVSCFSSSSLGIVEQISIPNQFPTISGAATSSQLSGISEYFQRLCPPDEYEANVLAEQANDYNISNVAIAVEKDDAYSENLGNAFQESFGAGAEIKINFAADDPDYTDKINQLIEAEPDAIFVSMLNPDEYVKFFSELEQLNSRSSLEEITFILCDALYSGGLFQAPVDFMLGDINGHPKNFGALPSADTTSESYTYFETQLRDKYEQEVASYNAQYFDIAYIYALAIERTFQQENTDDLVSFREELNKQIRLVSHGSPGDPGVGPQQGWNAMRNTCQAGGVDYTGASGNCNIDDEGNATTAYSVFKLVKIGNEYAFSIIKLIP